MEFRACLVQEGGPVPSRDGHPGVAGRERMPVCRTERSDQSRERLAPDVSRGCMWTGQRWGPIGLRKMQY